MALSNNRRAFYVVQFIELPFEGIDDYVCVPRSWLILVIGRRAAVAYPKDEDPRATKERVKRKKRYNNAWSFCMADIKYESDSYRDAELWIGTRNDYGPLVEAESTRTDTPDKHPVVVTQNQLQDGPQEAYRYSRDQTAPHGSITISFQGSQPSISIKRFNDVAAVGSRNVLQSVANVAPGSQNLSSSYHKCRRLNGHESLLAQEQLLTREDNAISRDKIEQKHLGRSTESNNCIHRPCSQTNRMTIPSTSQNSTYSPNLSNQTADLPEEKQLTQQDLQQINIFNRHQPSLQGVTKKAQPYTLKSRILNSIVQALSPTHNTCLQNEQQLRARQSESLLGNETHLDVMAKACQTDECVVEEALSPHHAVISVSNAVMVHEGSEMSTDEAPVETTSHAYDTSDASGRSFANRPMTATNSTSLNHQTQPKVVMVQQMLEQFVPLFTRMGAMLHYSRDQINNLRTSILESAKTYEKLLDVIEKFNKIGIPTSNASPLINLTPGVPQVREQRHADRPTAASNSTSLNHQMQPRVVLQQQMLEQFGSFFTQMGSIFHRSCDMVNNFRGSILANAKTYEKILDLVERLTPGVPHAMEERHAERPTAAPNSTSLNYQIQPRVVLEQQMMEQLGILFTQMGATLRYSGDVLYTLRSSILESANTRKKSLDIIERFIEMGIPASNTSPLYNSKPGVPQATEERHAEVTARAGSSDATQRSNHVPNDNLCRFVLPPAYDPYNTRWTLKYRKMMPGLVALMPRSRIYVSYGELKHCQQVSVDCQSLARRLLKQVFNREALSVCLTFSERAASDDIASLVRPGLDEHASRVLLDFVIEYGRQCGWNTDTRPVLTTIDSKIHKIRLKCGKIVEVNNHQDYNLSYF